MTVINNIKNFNNEKMNSIVSRINIGFQHMEREPRNNKVETMDGILRDVLDRLDDVIHFIRNDKSDKLLQFYKNESYVNPWVLEKLILDLAVGFQIISNINMEILQGKYRDKRLYIELSCDLIIKRIAMKLNTSHHIDLVEALGCETKLPEYSSGELAAIFEINKVKSYNPTVEEMENVYRMIKEFTVKENTFLVEAVKILLNNLHSASDYLYKE